MFIVDVKICRKGEAQKKFIDITAVCKEGVKVKKVKYKNEGVSENKKRDS